LNKDEIHDLLGEPQSDGLTLVPNESYNEELIAEKIKSFGPEARDLLFDATLSNSIIGYGQRNFGVMKIEDKFLEINELYKKYGILFNNPRNANLNEDDLTPNRLMRFFRYDIRDWIQKNNTPSFLWRKYSRKDPAMMSICFRGAEYMEDLTPQQADYLIEAHINMDRALGRNMVDRVIRTFDARGQEYTITPPRRGNTRQRNSNQGQNRNNNNQGNKPKNTQNQGQQQGNNNQNQGQQEGKNTQNQGQQQGKNTQNQGQQEGKNTQNQGQQEGNNSQNQNQQQGKNTQNQGQQVGKNVQNQGQQEGKNVQNQGQQQGKNQSQQGKNAQNQGQPQGTNVPLE